MLKINIPCIGSSPSSILCAVDVVTTSPAADAATVTIASANELVEALVCAFCSSTAKTKEKRENVQFKGLCHSNLQCFGKKCVEIVIKFSF